MKKQINLYQPSCYPKREKMTFKQFALLVTACLIFALLFLFHLGRQLSETETAIDQHKEGLKHKQQHMMVLVTQLQKKRAPEAKIREQKLLQTEVETKQALLRSLAGIDLEVSLSFSELMRGLSLAQIDSVSIEKFSILRGRLNISGQAEQSNSVPLWLSKVQKTQELKGTAFEKLNISENDTGFSFLLSNSLADKTEQGVSQ